MIKFFADTADLGEIAHCYTVGVDDGITTNPSIMATTGDLSKGFEHACKAILAAYPQSPISLETDLGGIPVSEIVTRKREVRDRLISQGKLLASWGDNVVVKIPICQAGLEAVRVLHEEGIKTNVTACMTPYQALMAAEAGATYVSLFSNRMVDREILRMSGRPLDFILEGEGWKSVVKDEANRDRYLGEAWKRTLNDIAYVATELRSHYRGTELIVGSIRSVEDMDKLVTAQPHIITTPSKIVRGMSNPKMLKDAKMTFTPRASEDLQSLNDPMTLYTISEFEAAAKKYQTKS